MNRPHTPFWDTVNLLVGNDKESKTTRKGRNTIALATISVYLLLFTVGLFLGTAFGPHQYAVSHIVGLITTIVVFSTGSSILTDCYKKYGNIYHWPGIISLMMILVNLAFVFNLLTLPFLGLLFHVVSLTTMIWLYKTHNSK